MGKYIGKNPAYGTFEKQVLNPNGIDNSFNLIYQAGSATSLRVSYGGIEQEPDVDYTLDDGGKKIVFSFIPQIGFRLYLIYLGRELSVPSFTGSFPIYYTAVGDNSSVDFNLPIGSLSPNTLIVFKNRQLSRYSEEWTVLGNVVTFVTAPTVLDVLDFYILGIERTDLVTVDPLSISTDKIYPGAVTPDKLNLTYISYSPALDTFGGMNLVSSTVHSAEWMDTGKCIKLRLHFTAQVDGGDNKIRFQLPVNNNGSTNVPGSCTICTATGMETGIVRWGADDALDVFRQNGVNYLADTYTIEINMEYESA